MAPSRSRFELAFQLFRRAHPEMAIAERASVEQQSAVRWLSLVKYRQTWAVFFCRFLADPLWFFYVFWIPVCLGAASVFGLLLALSYSVLLAAIDLWMPQPGSPLVTQPNSFMTTYGWRAICGAIAGGVIGWPVMKDWSAMWVVGMGIASALVSGFMNRPKPRSLAL